MDLQLGEAGVSPECRHTDIQKDRGEIDGS